MFGSELYTLISTATPSQQIQASGQQIELFEKLQIECGIMNPLKIPLHSNVQWGTAFNMLSRSFQLRQVHISYCFLA